MDDKSNLKQVAPKDKKGRVYREFMGVRQTQISEVVCLQRTKRDGSETKMHFGEDDEYSYAVYAKGNYVKVYLSRKTKEGIEP